jgi:hypothetical protein
MALNDRRILVLFFLSSDYSPRYKQDILRCLAAPIGSVVQFRYDKVHIPEDVLKKLVSTGTQFPLEGVVCSVATKGIGVLPIVPVRKVRVQKPRVHGETISIKLVVDQVVVADSAGFTSELDSLTNNRVPRIKEEGQNAEGYYLFEAEMPSKTEVGSSVSIWERTVSALRQQHAYKDEPFFWVALGIESSDKQLDTSELHPWRNVIEPRGEYRLLVYHFQPRGGPRPDSKMEVTFGDLLQSVTPPDTKIDSRYDLKSWWFSSSDNAQRTQPTWIRIRTADSWDMDLTINVGASYWRTVASGALVAVPAILALAPQGLDLQTKFLLGAGGMLVGILSSYLASSRPNKK